MEHDSVLIRRLDPIEHLFDPIDPGSGRAWLQVLFYGEFDVFGGYLAPPLVELNARPELERPGLIVLRLPPLGREAWSERAGIGVAVNQWRVNVIPELIVTHVLLPGKRIFDSPRGNGGYETTALSSRFPHSLSCCRGSGNGKSKQHGEQHHSLKLQSNLHVAKVSADHNSSLLLDIGCHGLRP